VWRIVNPLLEAAQAVVDLIYPVEHYSEPEGLASCPRPDPRINVCNCGADEQNAALANLRAAIASATEREAAVEELVKATDELTRAVSIRQMSTVLPEDEYKSEDEYKKAVSDYSDAMFRLVLARNRADTALAALSREVKP
jgi:hypothetical protein